MFERGAKFLRGPVNPSTNYECGMLVEGFDSDPMVMMTYNPPYYPALMDGVGLRKAKDLLRLPQQRQHHRHEENRPRGRTRRRQPTASRSVPST